MIEAEFDPDLESIEYVSFCPDLSDPIDASLVDYRQLMLSDQLPTIAENRRMIIGSQERDPDAMRGLLRMNKGLVAAEAYAFKGRGLASEALLMIGAEALLKAGLSYKGSKQGDFNNYAAGIIEEALGGALPHAVAAARENLTSSSPMDRVIERVTRLEDPNRPVQPINEPITQMFGRLAADLASVRHNHIAERVKQLDPQTQKLLPLLHLENAKVSHITGISKAKLIKVLGRAKRELGITSESSPAPLAEDGRVELALAAHEAGIEFDLKPVPPLDHLTTRERMIAGRLGKQNTAIAKELGLTRGQIGRSMTVLFKATSAKTRTELALMAQVYGFGLVHEPPEERDNPLKEYEPAHQLVLQNLHLHFDDMIEISGLSDDVVHGVIWRCEEKNSPGGPDLALNRVQLAKELHRRGVKYAIREPKKPLAQALNIKQWKIASSLESSNAEIGKSIGETENYVSGALYTIHARLGSRSRVELALMMEIHDTGERPKELTPRDKLHAKLNVPKISDAKLNRLIGQLTDLQQRCVSGYYLRKQPISYSALAKELDMRDFKAVHYATQRGVRKMCEILEAQRRSKKPNASVKQSQNVFDIDQTGPIDTEAEDERLVA